MATRAARTPVGTLVVLGVLTLGALLALAAVVYRRPGSTAPPGAPSAAPRENFRH